MLYLIAHVLCFILLFFLFRLGVAGYLSKVLSKKKRRNMFKEQNFSEKIFYLKYRENLPKFMLIAYYCYLIIFVIFFLTTVVMIALNVPESVLAIIAKIHWLGGGMLVVSLFSHTD